MSGQAAAAAKAQTKVVQRTQRQQRRKNVFLQALVAPRLTFKATPTHGDSFDKAILSNDSREAWIAYRGLVSSAEKLAKMHPDDHTRMLVMLTRHTLPSVAQAHASLVVKTMAQLGIRLDVRDYHALLSIHLRLCDRERMEEVMSIMEEATGSVPDVTSFNLMLAAHAQAGDMQALMQTWERCVSVHPLSSVLNMDGHAILMESHGQAGDFNAVLEIYKGLCQRLSGTGFVVGRVVHEAMIRALGHCGRLDSAKDAFDRLTHEDGLDGLSHFADEHLYDAVIDACQAQADLAGAEKYWQRMVDMCRQADHWMSRMDATMQDEDRSRAEACLDERASAAQRPEHSRRPHPLPVTYLRMIQMLIQAERYDCAAELFEEHIATVLPERQTFEEIVLMYLRNGDAEKAKEVYDAMMNRGYRATVDLAKQVELIE